MSSSNTTYKSSSNTILKGQQPSSTLSIQGETFSFRENNESSQGILHSSERFTMVKHTTQILTGCSLLADKKFYAQF